MIVKIIRFTLARQNMPTSCERIDRGHMATLKLRSNIGVRIGAIMYESSDTPELTPVYHNMPVFDKLSCLAPVGSKAHAKYHGVETAFYELEKHFSGNSLLSFGFMKILSELPFKKSVHFSDLLLFSQLHAVIGQFLKALAMLSGRIFSPLNSAFLRMTPVSFKKKLFPFPAANSA
jgi:hypothetical protein